MFPSLRIRILDYEPVCSTRIDCSVRFSQRRHTHEVERGTEKFPEDWNLTYNILG